MTQQFTEHRMSYAARRLRHKGLSTTNCHGARWPWLIFRLGTCISSWEVDIRPHSTPLISLRGDQRHSLVKVTWCELRQAWLIGKKARVSSYFKGTRRTRAPSPECCDRFVSRFVGQVSTMNLSPISPMETLLRLLIPQMISFSRFFTMSTEANRPLRCDPNASPNHSIGRSDRLSVQEARM